jgi:hypothetical protein
MAFSQPPLGILPDQSADAGPPELRAIGAGPVHAAVACMGVSVGRSTGSRVLAALRGVVSRRDVGGRVPATDAPYLMLPVAPR